MSWFLAAVTHLVPNAHGPRTFNWSLWTNSPQPIRSSWTDSPQKFGPHGQMVPNQFGPPRQMVPIIFCLSRGTGCRDPEIQGPNLLRTICPGGLILWESFVQENRKSGDQMGSGPNASQPSGRVGWASSNP